MAKARSRVKPANKQLISYSLVLGTTLASDVILSVGRQQYILHRDETNFELFSGDIDLGREILGAKLYLQLDGKTAGPNEHILAEIELVYNDIYLGRKRMSLEVNDNSFKIVLGYLLFITYDEPLLSFNQDVPLE